MATLAQILDAMADQIRDALDDVTNVDLQVEPRMVLSPTPPTIDLYPGDPSTDPTLAAYGEKWGGEIVTVRVRVSPSDSNAGQDLLLALMDDEDPLSIVLALDDDPTLAGLASTLAVQSRTGYTLFPDLTGDAYLGCTFGVVVVKARS